MALVHADAERGSMASDYDPTSSKPTLLYQIENLLADMVIDVGESVFARHEFCCHWYVQTIFLVPVRNSVTLE